MTNFFVESLLIELKQNHSTPQQQQQQQKKEKEKRTSASHL
jgi:hypothetical protein